MFFLKQNGVIRVQSVCSAEHFFLFLPVGYVLLFKRSDVYRVTKTLYFKCACHFYKLVPNKVTPLCVCSNIQSVKFWNSPLQSFSLHWDNSETQSEICDKKRGKEIISVCICSLQQALIPTEPELSFCLFKSIRGVKWHCVIHMLTITKPFLRSAVLCRDRSLIIRVFPHVRSWVM